MEDNRIIEEFFEANPDPYLERIVDLEMDFLYVMDVHHSSWPNEVQHILRKRGGIGRLRIKDIVKIEQIIGYQIIKIEK